MRFDLPKNIALHYRFRISSNFLHYSSSVHEERPINNTHLHVILISVYMFLIISTLFYSPFCYISFLYLLNLRRQSLAFTVLFDQIKSKTSTVLYVSQLSPVTTCTYLLTAKNYSFCLIPSMSFKIMFMKLQSFADTTPVSSHRVVAGNHHGLTFLAASSSLLSAISVCLCVCVCIKWSAFYKMNHFS